MNVVMWGVFINSVLWSYDCVIYKYDSYLYSNVMYILCYCIIIVVMMSILNIW